MAWPALPVTPTIELMLMIEPLRCLSIVLSTAFVELKADLRFTRMTVSNCSSVMRRSRLSIVMPALLMTTSMEPNAAAFASIAAFVSAILLASA